MSLAVLALVSSVELTEAELWPQPELLVVRHVLFQLLSMGLLPSSVLEKAMDKLV